MLWCRSSFHKKYGGRVCTETTNFLLKIIIYLLVPGVPVPSTFLLFVTLLCALRFITLQVQHACSFYPVVPVVRFLSCTVQTQHRCIRLPCYHLPWPLHHPRNWLQDLRLILPPYHTDDNKRDTHNCCTNSKPSHE